MSQLNDKIHYLRAAAGETESQDGSTARALGEANKRVSECPPCGDCEPGRGRGWEDVRLKPRLGFSLRTESQDSPDRSGSVSWDASLGTEQINVNNDALTVR